MTEHLEAGSGSPLPPSGSTGGKRRKGRKGLLIGGAVGAAALVGGGVWAWMAFFGQGPQPAEALPDNTLVYVSIDLDPSGQQKVEAIKTLRKFPAFKDEIGLDTDDDVRKKLLDLVQDEGACEGIDFKNDIEPWLGQRAAMAIVDRGSEQPAPVVVVQVKDQDKAAKGLEDLVGCAGDSAGEDELAGYAFNGDWVVLAENEKIAKAVVEDAKEGSLDDDDDYQHWTEAAGDPGIINVYAAPEAGQELLDFMDDEFGDMIGEAMMPGQMTDALKDFKGMAGTVRFDSGDIEVEFAGGTTQAFGSVVGGDKGGDVVSTLPDDTAVAIGAGFEEGWTQTMLDQLEPMIEDMSGMSLDDAIDEAEMETGLTLPDDIETLVGDSLAFALSGDFDIDQVIEGGPTELPVGAKIQGDPGEIEEVIEKITSQLGDDGDYVIVESTDDYVLVGPSPDYVEELKDKGNLGSSDRFRDVVPEAGRASAVAYVNFDAGDWLVRVAESEDEDEAVENLKPLEALGFSTWREGDEEHTLLRLTTED